MFITRKQFHLKKCTSVYIGYLIFEQKRVIFFQKFFAKLTTENYIIFCLFIWCFVTDMENLDSSTTYWFSDQCYNRWVHGVDGSCRFDPWGVKFFFNFSQKKISFPLDKVLLNLLVIFFKFTQNEYHQKKLDSLTKGKRISLFTFDADKLTVSNTFIIFFGL